MAFNLIGKFNKIHVTNATMSMQKRGPDHQDIYIDEWACLGHRRLSIIDTTAVAHQPMWDNSGRYCIVFNGEIFNYRELRQDLEGKGISFTSGSDTEVLLKLFIHEGEACLSRLNGFFAFCIYDKTENSFLLARDRFGVKPLLYLFDEDKFIFASEMKTIIEYGIDRSLDHTSLYTYLQLNYIPAPDTIFHSVKKLLPGHTLRVRNSKISIRPWYEIPYSQAVAKRRSIDYDSAKKELKTLLDEAVQRRLVADVPLGAFLSGGIDSSIITAIASQHKPDLHTFSIGFKDEKFFDETAYATLAAKHFKTDHTVFSLTNDDLYAHLHNVLNYIDEPFADSSAINVYILSKETRKHATVALSGDGADELLAGYNKHAAFYKFFNKGWKESSIEKLLPLWKILPQSRNSTLGNSVRQLKKFAEVSKLSSQEKYWKLAGFSSEPEASNLLSSHAREKVDINTYHARKNHLTRFLSKNEADINDVLRSDMELVLPNDMLTKVDLMSMANGLEVRTPFLDYKLVNFLFSLPGEFKINHNIRKRILQDTYRDTLPPQLYNRPKKGFEVPLLKWFRTELREHLKEKVFSRELIEQQGIFNYTAVQALQHQLFSRNPGDVHAKVWALLVFQSWWSRYHKA